MLKILILAPLLASAVSLTSPLEVAPDPVVTVTPGESALLKMSEQSLRLLQSEFAFSANSQVGLAKAMHKELVGQGYTEKEAWFQLIDFLNNDLVALIEISVCPPTVTKDMALKNFDFLFDLAEACEALTENHTGVALKADTFLITLGKTFSDCN